MERGDPAADDIRSMVDPTMEPGGELDDALAVDAATLETVDCGMAVDASGTPLETLISGSPHGAIGAPLEALLRALDSAAAPIDAEPHIRAFTAWITNSEESARSLRVLAEEAARLSGAARTYRHVAVLGFAADADGAPTSITDAQLMRAAALQEGLAWLAGREWFIPGRVPTFEADPVALLGVARGIAAVVLMARGPELRAPTLGPSHLVESTSVDLAGLSHWAERMLTESAEVVTEQWEQGLVAAGRHAIAPSVDLVRRMVEATPDLAVALAAARRIDLGSSGLGADEAALELIGALSYRTAGADRAAAQAAALRWLVRSAAVVRPNHATVLDVLTLLQGVERSLRRWTWENKPSTRGATLVRWPVVNEYHVQNLLWTVLAPVFPDLEDEEQLPSFGQKHPRYDLGIPSLQLIVEVKFVRGGSSRAFAEVVEQVAADASLYLGERSRYRHLIVFVWDNSQHTEQHAELRQGLLKLSGVAGAVVVTRPGRMGHPERRRAAP